MASGKLNKALEDCEKAHKDAEREMRNSQRRVYYVMYPIVGGIFVGSVALGYLIGDKVNYYVAVLILMGGFFAAGCLSSVFSTGPVGMLISVIVAGGIFLLFAVFEVIHCFTSCKCKCFSCKYSSSTMIPVLWDFKSFYTILVVCMIAGYVIGAIVGHVNDMEGEEWTTFALGALITMSIAYLAAFLAIKFVNSNFPVKNCSCELDQLICLVAVC